MQTSTANQPTAPRVYCGYCHISFGTHEPRTTHDGKTVHTNCKVKLEHQELTEAARQLGIRLS